MTAADSDANGSDQRPDEPIDEWMRRRLLAEYGPDGDTTIWPAGDVARVMATLQAARPPGASPLLADVLWIPETTAFTLPGRYVYIARRLLERCASDAPVAFTLAHEIAHHDLGHLHGVDEMAVAVPRTFRGGRSSRAALIVVGLIIERRVHGPEKEAAADHRALEMCLASGYDGHRCLQVFDILESVALDRGDLDAVFGLEDALDPEAREHHPWLLDARIWAWERLRGYLPIRERKARLRTQLLHAHPSGWAETVRPKAES
jgi:predicted Zn-dependent protease